MFSFIKIIKPANLGKAAAAIAAAIAIPSCGGGGGGSGNPATEPAPQTLNALTLSPAPGFDMTFIRDAGDTLNGVNETGTVVITMTPEGKTGDTDVREVGGDYVVINYTDDVFLVDYTYTRIDANSGRIQIVGSSSENPAGSYFTASFDYTYDITFGTNGSTITGIVLTDTTATPDLNWLSAALQIYGGAGDVPVGYSVQLSNGQDLPYLYPEESLAVVDIMRIFPDGPSDELEYSFLTSATRSTTNLDGTTYTLQETGVAQENNLVTNVNPSVEYEYLIDELTIDKAQLKIFTSPKAINAEPIRNYQLTFGDKKSGSYVENVSGDTGDFTLPTLEN